MQTVGSAQSDDSGEVACKPNETPRNAWYAAQTNDAHNQLVSEQDPFQSVDIFFYVTRLREHALRSLRASNAYSDWRMLRDLYSTRQRG